MNAKLIVFVCAGSASTPGLLQVPDNQTAVVGGGGQDAGWGHISAHGTNTTRGDSCLLWASHQRYAHPLSLL